MPWKDRLIKIPQQKSCFMIKDWMLCPLISGTRISAFFFLLICSYFIYSRNDSFCWPYLLLLIFFLPTVCVFTLMVSFINSYFSNTVEFFNIFLYSQCFLFLRIPLQTYSPMSSFQNFIILGGNADQKELKGIFLLFVLSLDFHWFELIFYHA